MANARGARQGKLPPIVEKQVEKLSKEIKIPAVVYDITRKPTTEFIRNEKSTTEYMRIARSTTEYIRKTEPTTEFIKKTEPTIKYEEVVEPTTRYEEKVVPTTRYDENVEKTTRYDPVVEKTIKFEVENDKIKLEEVVQTALDSLMKKNRIVVPKPNFEDVRINVFEFIVKCPECGCEHSLGGRKK